MQREAHVAVYKPRREAKETNPAATLVLGFQSPRVRKSSSTD